MKNKRRRHTQNTRSTQAAVYSTGTAAQKKHFANDEAVRKCVHADGTLTPDKNGTIPFRTKQFNFYKTLPHGNCMIAAVNCIVSPTCTFRVPDFGAKHHGGGYSYGQLSQVLQSTPFVLAMRKNLINQSLRILTCKQGFFILRGFHFVSKAHHAIVWDANRSLMHDRAGYTFQVTSDDCSNVKAADAFFSDLGYGLISEVAELRVYSTRLRMYSIFINLII